MRWNNPFSILDRTTAAIILVTLILVISASAQVEYRTLYKFKGAEDGFFPLAGLVFDSAGNLYSTIAYGISGGGAVFQLTPKTDGSWTKSVVHTFNYTDGANSKSSLIFDRAGSMYGTTQVVYGGYGVVFRLTPKPDGTWTESVLYTFSGGADGGSPWAGLTIDSAGNLYGTTYSGGNLNNCSDGGCGVVFKLTANPDGSWTESVLHQFQNGYDGANPGASLIFDAAGNLYGTTLYGGGGPCQIRSGGCGTIFKLTPNQDGSWTEKVLHRFTGGGDGSVPQASLILDSAGSLYSTSATGGNYGWGTLFKLTPSSDGGWAYHVLHQFAGVKNGGQSVASLVLDAVGSLYGTAQYGSPQNYGVVFKLTPGSDGRWAYHVLHVFLDNPGTTPSAGLIFDKAGNLYGTTLGDGFTTFGSVFEITP